MEAYLSVKVRQVIIGRGAIEASVARDCATAKRWFTKPEVACEANMCLKAGLTFCKGKRLLLFLFT